MVRLLCRATPFVISMAGAGEGSGGGVGIGISTGGSAMIPMTGIDARSERLRIRWLLFETGFPTVGLGRGCT